MRRPLFFIAIASSLAFLLWLNYGKPEKGKEKNKIIFTNDAPAPIGPYSQAILKGNALFIAGQIGKNPKTGILDTTGIEGQTKQTLENIKAILQAAGMGLENLVKTTIYLTHIEDFKTVNEIYATYFPENPPARETVQVLGLPGKANIEISGIAVKD
jgi:2-iminobutanoate/2-iminopropanoate deaminase